MKINDYFDNIYLLNLHKRRQRLEKSTSKLNELGIKHDVFHGCDGYVLNHIWNKLQSPYFSNPRYLGCAISHLSIYQDAIESGYERILIIEDDNLIHKNIQNLFDSFEIPDYTDLIYLGYIPLSEDMVMWTYENTYDNRTALNSNFFTCKNLWGLFSYGLTSNLMKELLSVYNNEFPMELDRYFVKNIQPRGNSVAVIPQLFCCDDDIHSDNTGWSEHLSTKSIDHRFSSRNDYI
jgi:GR25 family glycosyltransferase involved in LPS biosynthesis